MILVLEIAMLVWGIIALVKGKLKISKTKEVRGAKARLLGVVLVLPLPLAMMAGFVIGFTAARNGAVNMDSLKWTLIGVEAGIVLTCLALAVVGGMVMGQPPVEAAGFPVEQQVR